MLQLHMQTNFPKCNLSLQNQVCKRNVQHLVGQPNMQNIICKIECVNSTCKAPFAHNSCKATFAKVKETESEFAKLKSRTKFVKIIRRRHLCKTNLAQLNE